MTDLSATPATDAPSAEATGKVRVWDPVIRIFHWGLVVAFAVAYLSAEDTSTLHEVAGYVVAGLVAVRVVWGLIGSKYARFPQFLRGPSATVAYLRDMVQGRERRYLGHNPAGAAMIVVLLLALSGTALTEWLMTEPGRVAMLPDLPQIVSPAYADEDDAYGEQGAGGGEALEEIHEVFANLMLLLIAVHIAGVAFASYRHRENLARAMVTGDKRAPEAGDIS